MSGEATDTGPDLAGIEALARAADAQLDQVEQLPAVPGAVVAPERDRGAEVAALIGLGVAMLAPVLPFLPACYPADTLRSIGAAFVAVADKHGWNLDAADSPELALAFVTIPPTVAAVVQGRAHFAQLRAERARAGQAAHQAPAAAPAPAVERAPTNDGRVY